MPLAWPTQDLLEPPACTAERALHALLDRPAAAAAGDYLHALCTTLGASVLAPGGHRLGTVIDPAADLVLPGPVLRCLGRVVAEAVANAARHAYPAGATGHVVLTLSRAGAGLRCTIADDGIGSFGAPARPGCRGMILMDGLAQQIGGVCRWVFGRRGTTVQVTWPARSGATRSGATRPATVS